MPTINPNKKLSLVLSIALLMSTIAIGFSKDVQAAKKKKSPITSGITVVQNHHLLGPCKTYITPNSVKVEFSRQDWQVFAKAPDWGVYLINPKTNQFYKHSFKIWNTKGLHSIELVRSGVYIKKRLSKGKPGSYYGYDTKLYRVLGDNARYTCLDNWSHARQIDTILQKTFNTPWAKGIPLFLKVKSSTKDSNVESTRITYLVSKQLENRLETFCVVKGIKAKMAVPKGAKPVNSERVIVMGKQKQKTLSNFYDALNHN